MAFPVPLVFLLFKVKVNTRLFNCNFIAYLMVSYYHCMLIIIIIIIIIISSSEPLGSQGELIVYPSSRRPSVCPSVVINFKLFSETAGPIKAKFYMESPWVGGTIFCSWHLGHMTKMAATPIYGKKHSKIFFSRTSKPIFIKLFM